jgi:hypothetical protein
MGFLMLSFAAPLLLTGFLVRPFWQDASSWQYFKDEFEQCPRYFQI